MVHEIITNLTETAKMILSEAKKQGADNASVNITQRDDIGTRYGENHITQNMSTNTQQFILQTQIGGKIGKYTANRPNVSNISMMVKDGLTLTKFSADDKTFPGFIESQPNYKTLNVPLDQIDADEISQHIKQVIEAGMAVDSKISTIAGNIQHITTHNVILNTFDVLSTQSRSLISGVVNIAARENENEARSNARTSGRTIDDLQLQSAAVKVAERARDGLNQEEFDIGRYEAVLGYQSVAALIRFVAMGSSSEGLVRHTSFLKDKIGEEVFDKRISLLDDTDNISHYGSQTYDSEQTATNPIQFIENGVFKEYAYNRRTAKLLGSESNGRNAAGFGGEMPFFRTLTLKSGFKTEEELIESVDDGIYITNLFYNNFVNPPEGVCTGLTRDGLFKIKNGELKGALKNFRWTDSLLSILKNAEPGNNQSQTGGFMGMSAKIVPLRVSEFNLSSKGKH